MLADLKNKLGEAFALLNRIKAEVELLGTITNETLNEVKDFIKS